MATWFDLPAELRVSIFLLLLQDFVVYFKPRSRETRQAVRMQQPDLAPGSLDSLLLVSKSFMTYTEMTEMLLRASTICLRKRSDINNIFTSFGKSALCRVRELVIPQLDKDIVGRQHFLGSPTLFKMSMPLLRHVHVHSQYVHEFSFDFPPADEGFHTAQTAGIMSTGFSNLQNDYWLAGCDAFETMCRNEEYLSIIRSCQWRGVAWTISFELGLTGDKRRILVS